MTSANKKRKYVEVCKDLKGLDIQKANLEEQKLQLEVEMVFGIEQIKKKTKKDDNHNFYLYCLYIHFCMLVKQ